MDYFKKKQSLLYKIKKNRKLKERKEEFFVNCPKCNYENNKNFLDENYYICESCNNNLKMPIDKRLELIFDSYKKIDINVERKNNLNFPRYDEKLNNVREKTGLEEAVVVVKGKINSFETYAFILDSDFLMGSLSRDVGHIIVNCFNMAKKDALPVISFVASGGARMQEGIFSLMQMANTTFALKEHSEEKNLYVSIMTNPTTGGVPASFANLGDINLAEPGAMIGFTGPRVIEQTINRKLPEGFQSAEFLLEKGFLDDIIKRENLKSYLGKILEYHQR